MEINELISEQDILEMVKDYYKECEEKEVIASCTVGKVVSGKKYLPATAIVHFDIREVMYYRDREIMQPIPVDQDDIERILSTMLAKRGVEITKAEIEMDKNSPYTFAGMRIEGTQNTLEQENSKGSI